MEFCEGVLGGKEVVVVRSGIGKVNAAVCTQILVDDFKADTVINTGIDDGICLKIIHQDLGADSRINFSNAASYHNNLFSAENALTKFHMGFLYGSSHQMCIRDRS